MVRGTTQIKIAPKVVFDIAQTQALVDGRKTLGAVRKNASASIPGHAKRYPADRHPECLVFGRAFHQVSHLRLK